MEIKSEFNGKNVKYTNIEFLRDLTISLKFQSYFPKGKFEKLIDEKLIPKEK